MNFAEIQNFLFEIRCLQKLITRGQTDATKYIISRRSTAGGWREKEEGVAKLTSASGGILYRYTTGTPSIRTALSCEPSTALSTRHKEFCATRRRIDFYPLSAIIVIEMPVIALRYCRCQRQTWCIRTLRHNFKRMWCFFLAEPLGKLFIYLIVYCCYYSFWHIFS